MDTAGPLAAAYGIVLEALKEIRVLMNTHSEKGATPSTLNWYINGYLKPRCKDARIMPVFEECKEVIEKTKKEEDAKAIDGAILWASDMLEAPRIV